MYFSVIFDLSSSVSAVGEGVVIVLVSIAVVGSLLADIVGACIVKVTDNVVSRCEFGCLFKY